MPLEVESKNILKLSVNKANDEGRRLVVPLLGFPGLNLCNCTVKLAQQNYGEHFKVLKSITDEFMPDALFPLMDLSVEANALGRYTIFPKKESATVLKDDFTNDDLENLKEINISFDTRLQGYVETQKLMSVGLPKNILRGAYVTGPYTLACLLMGADEGALATIMNPDYLEEVCRVATEKIQEYINLLITAGAQIICVLEPSAVMLGPEQFKKFSGDYVRSFCNSSKYSDVAFVYHVCGNTMHIVEEMAESGVDALSLDGPDAGIDLQKAAEKVNKETIIIGNISPIGKLFNGNPTEVENEVEDLLEKMERFPNFILSSGCDLPQETTKENIHAFMNTGRNYAKI